MIDKEEAEKKIAAILEDLEELTGGNVNNISIEKIDARSITDVYGRYM